MPCNKTFPVIVHTTAPGTGKNSLPVQELQERLFQAETGAEDDYKKMSR